MALQNDLDKMVTEGVISTETARSIRLWYTRKEPDNQRLMLVFGVLGALLVVTGILLVLAHNWDSFSITIKTAWAFLPLILGQAAVAYTLWKKPDQEWWREVSATWLALSIGICIALIAQIYHLPGDLSGFLLTWLLLGGLLVYLLPSNVVALLFLAGSGWYASEAGYRWQDSFFTGSEFWGLLLFLVPFYYRLWHKKRTGFFTRLFHFGFPVVMLIGLGMYAGGTGYGWMWMAFASLLSVFYIIGVYLKTLPGNQVSNGYHFLGGLGSLIFLFMGTFMEFWKEIRGNDSLKISQSGSYTFTMALLLTALGIGLLYSIFLVKKTRPWKPLAFSFLLFAAMFAVAQGSPGLAVIPANLYILALGVWVLTEGAKTKSFLRLNTGLGLIAILAICRFFDTDLSFVLRGVIFISVGLGFGFANYRLLQKKKGHA